MPPPGRSGRLAGVAPSRSGGRATGRPRADRSPARPRRGWACRAACRASWVVTLCRRTVQREAELEGHGVEEVGVDLLAGDMGTHGSICGDDRGEADRVRGQARRAKLSRSRAAARQASGQDVTAKVFELEWAMVRGRGLHHVLGKVVPHNAPSPYRVWATCYTRVSCANHSLVESRTAGMREVSARLGGLNGLPPRS